MPQEARSVLAGLVASVALVIWISSAGG